MEIKKMKIRDLKKYTEFVKKVKKEKMDAIRYSIEKYGYVEPIIVNKRTNKILNGNTRINILLMNRGLNDEIDVVMVDLDEKKEKELVAAINGIDGEWDISKLKMLISKYELGINNYGFEKGLIKKMEKEELEFERDNDDFEIGIEMKEYAKSELLLRLKFDDFEMYDFVNKKLSELMKKYGAKNYADLFVKMFGG